MLSVVVSIYNGEKYLNRCLHSFDNQINENFELILINDGSTDSSKNICEEYVKIHKNAFLYSKNNGGLSSARQEGFKHVHGEYVIFVDCDDYVSNNFIEEFEKIIIKENNPDMIICSYNVVCNTNIEKKIFPLESKKYSNDLINNYTLRLLDSNYNNLPAFLWLRCMKREKIEEKFFISERLCYTEDLLFDLLYANKIENLYVTHKRLYNYCINEESLTNKYRENIWEMFKYRYNWIKKYCLENNIINLVSEQLNFMLWSSIVFSFENSLKKNKFFLIKKEMKNIREDQICKKLLIDLNKNLLNKKDKIRLFLIKNRLYYCYFILKKIKSRG